MLITGPVGVGKTSVLSEVTELLEAAGIPFAAVDLDNLSWCYPSPSDDRFRSALTLKNLAVVWHNFRNAGAERLVIARVVESRDELDRYRAAVPGADVTVVRLGASDATLRDRVDKREIGLGHEWHARRAIELARIMRAYRYGFDGMHDKMVFIELRIDSGRALNAQQQVDGPNSSGRVQLTLSIYGRCQTGRLEKTRLQLEMNYGTAGLSKTPRP